MHTKFKYLNIYLYKSFYASAFVIERSFSGELNNASSWLRISSRTSRLPIVACWSRISLIKNSSTTRSTVATFTPAPVELTVLVEKEDQEDIFAKIHVAADLDKKDSGLL